MIGRIAQNDWRNLRADRTIWAVGILLAFTIAYGVHNGAAWVRFQQSTLKAAIAEEEERLDGIRRGIEDANAGRTKPPSWRDPRSPFSVGYTTGARYAFMPPAPLSPLAVGQSDLLPYYYKVSLRSRDTILGNDEVENPIHLLAGRFDLAFVVIYLYPLLILALSYNLISGEKEDGTLAMTLAQPVRLRSIALGKIGFRGLFVLTLATAMSLAGFILTGADLTAEGLLPRFLLWTLAVAAYGAFWFAAAVAVNAFGKSSSTNALALAGMWLVFVLLIPSLLNVIVKAANPVPSRVDMIQAMRVASDDVTRERSRLMAKYLEDHPELAGAGEDAMAQLAIRNVAIMDELERRVQPVLARFDEQLERQQSLVDRYRYLSPAILTQSALYDLAGTSAHRHKHFLGMMERFHREWQEHFHPLMLRSVKLTPASIDEFPRFEFREEPLSSVGRRAAVCAAGLSVLTALAAMVAFGALRRYTLAG